VLWGGLHGAALVVHRGWRSLTAGWRIRESFAYRLVAMLAMQYFVLLTWIPFRVVDTRDMLYTLRKFLVFDMNFHVADTGLGALSPFATILLLSGFLLIHIASELWGGLDEHLARVPLPVAAVACVLIGALLFILWPPAARPFIYFQF
jgi:alginate O-acetyltransferase complex protein AlgI